VDHRQDGARSALRLPRHRHARHRRDHHRGPEERGLAGARREERHRHTPPVPYEVDLQQSESFLGFADRIGADPVTFSAITVKLSYAALFIAVLSR
jgi:hypothetical protein